MGHTSWRWWVRLTSALLGVLGLAVAITAVVVALPPPSVGGTCGPGRGSEAAIAAFFNPASIGAGARPPSTDLLGRLEWSAFVGQCQSSADGRMLLGLGILVLVALVVGAGFLLTQDSRSEAREHRSSPAAAGPPAGWYWDPAAPTSAPRWWTGGAWGPSYETGTATYPQETGWQSPGSRPYPQDTGWRPAGSSGYPPDSYPPPSPSPSYPAGSASYPTGLVPPPT